jgi:hypothetical protein
MKSISESPLHSVAIGVRFRVAAIHVQRVLAYLTAGRRILGRVDSHVGAVKRAGSDPIFPQVAGVPPTAEQIRSASRDRNGRQSPGMESIEL